MHTIIYFRTCILYIDILHFHIWCITCITTLIKIVQPQQYRVWSPIWWGIKSGNWSWNILMHLQSNQHRLAKRWWILIAPIDGNFCSKSIILIMTSLGWFWGTQFSDKSTDFPDFPVLSGNQWPTGSSKSLNDEMGWGFSIILQEPRYSAIHEIHPVAVLLNFLKLGSRSGTGAHSQGMSVTQRRALKIPRSHAVKKNEWLVGGFKP